MTKLFDVVKLKSVAEKACNEFDEAFFSFENWIIQEKKGVLL